MTKAAKGYGSRLDTLGMRCLSASRLSHLDTAPALSRAATLWRTSRAHIVSTNVHGVDGLQIAKFNPAHGVRRTKMARDGASKRVGCVSSPHHFLRASR